MGHRKFIASAILADLVNSVRHRHTSRVVESALMYCSFEDQQRLAIALLELGKDEFISMARHRYASNVLISFGASLDKCIEFQQLLLKEKFRLMLRQVRLDNRYTCRLAW